MPIAMLHIIVVIQCKLKPRHTLDISIFSLTKGGDAFLLSCRAMQVWCTE